MTKLAVVVLISGGGTNLQALIDAASNDLPIEIKAVISNRPGVFGLQRAMDAGLETAVLDHTSFNSREAFDQALARRIDSYQPELVVLAGFMRILSADFVRHFQGKMLNIHPSLLPKYQGLHTHKRALEAGDKEHGVSVHFVTEELDGGPVIAQARVSVAADDDENTLAAKVLEKEHVLYPLVVKWFATGDLKLNGDLIIHKNNALESPLQADS